MKATKTRWIAGLVSLVSILGALPVAAAPSAQVPGVVIDHLPARTGLYVGSPSIVVWTNGDYLASHDFFGPGSSEQQQGLTAVFRSGDGGLTWGKVATVTGQFWSTLFVNQGAVYLLGTDKHHGAVVIRRSLDGGETWTTPANAQSGLLRNDGPYHCAPTPVIEYAGRLWRGIERGLELPGRGSVCSACVMSAPANSDLLEAAHWTFSNFIPSSPGWNHGDMIGWLEGNVVVAPSGQIVDILRVDTAHPPERAAMVTLSPDGRNAAFDRNDGFIEFPGGAKKFTIRKDPNGPGYWTLASIAQEGAAHQPILPSDIRNTLALLHSQDLRHWKTRSVLLHHPDSARHGFQYADWQFDGSDIIVACRTAYDDSEGGAHSFHDANFLTFHRIRNFRSSP